MIFRQHNFFTEMVTKMSIFKIFCRFPQHTFYCLYGERKQSLPPKKMWIWTKSSPLSNRCTASLASVFLSAVVSMAITTQDYDPIITRSGKVKLHCIFSHTRHILIFPSTSVGQPWKLWTIYCGTPGSYFVFSHFSEEKKNATYKH